jgi:hypothetical protein
MAIPIGGATNVCVRWVGGKKCVKCAYSKNSKLKSHVK